MSVIGAVAVPHPPIIVPEVGRGEERKIEATAQAYRRAADFIRALGPDTLVVLSPHSVLYADYFHISPGERASGDLGQFRAGSVRFDVRYDTAFVRELDMAAGAANLPAGTLGERESRLDHGTMIPLYFLNEAYGGASLPAIVRIGLSGLPLEEHYRLGMCIRDVSEKLGRRSAIIASGDLSHKLLADGPYGFAPEGPEYDRRIMDVLGRGAFGELFDFSESFCEKAAECGHRSFVIMAGCFDGIAVKAESLSHEGTFGVGYGVCLFSPGAPEKSRRFQDARAEAEARVQAERRAKEDTYVRLARLTVETWVKKRRKPELPANLPEDMLSRTAGVFVSLHKHGRLRGCIGTISAVTDSVAQEIIGNAVSACSRDPRFDPVGPEELGALEITVDVLGPAQAIESPEALDPKRYGVIVSKGAKQGLLLPNLDGVDTVDEQIEIARQKAGIGRQEQIMLKRFEVVRHY